MLRYPTSVVSQHILILNPLRAVYNARMDRPTHYKQRFAQENPQWRESSFIYKDIIDAMVGRQTKLLDVGCGHGNLLQPVHAKTEHSYGIDPDAEAIAKNTFIKHKQVGTVEQLPYEDGFFDVVVLAWVLEHLPQPDAAFREIYRVLKPGGKVVFLTPNVWNYNVWIIRLIPERFHEFFTSRLYGRQENDTYPKQYKINSVRKMRKILGSIGFKEERIVLNGDPSYVSFNNALFRLASLWEKLTDWAPLRFTKVHIIGVFEK